MVKLRFEPAGIVCEGNVGDELIDITDANLDTDVPYSCRSASCGACRVEVKSGMSAFAEVGPEEQDVLDMFGDGDDIRLCCQLKVAKEIDEEVVLRVIEPN